MSFNKKYVDSFFERLGISLEDDSRKSMEAMRKQLDALKKQIKKIENSGFEDVDEIHLITIVMAQEIQMRAMVDVLQKGVMVAVDAAGKVKQKNHSISTFYQMAKMLNDTSKKVGLSALDRKVLDIENLLEDGLPDE